MRNGGTIALLCVAALLGFLAPARATHIDRAPYRAQWDGKAAQAGLWTGWLTDAIEGDGAVLTQLSPRDVRSFCPRYRELDAHERAQFWIVLISAISERESDFEHAAYLDEPPPLSERSIGLMQLSLSDVDDYGCAFASEEEIADPEKNLKCAVQIMGQLVMKDDVIGGAPRLDRKGAAAYWSVLMMTLAPSSSAAPAR